MSFSSKDTVSVQSLVRWRGPSGIQGPTPRDEHSATTNFGPRIVILHNLSLRKVVVEE